MVAEKLKGAKATCMKIGERMEKCFRMKYILLISMSLEIFRSYEHSLAVLFRKLKHNFPCLYFQTTVILKPSKIKSFSKPPNLFTPDLSYFRGMVSVIVHVGIKMRRQADMVETTQD